MIRENEQEIMNTFTADPALQESLSALPGLTEVRDVNGHVLGYYSPADRPTAEQYARAAARFDPSEIQRRKEAGIIGRTTSEVLARLKAMDE